MTSRAGGAQKRTRWELHSRPHSNSSLHGLELCLHFSFLFSITFTTVHYGLPCRHGRDCLALIGLQASHQPDTADFPRIVSSPCILQLHYRKHLWAITNCTNLAEETA